MLNDYEKVMKAAGDPMRARILKLLEDGELCVCQIMEILGLSQSTVSGHLAVLKEAGLVTVRKEGRWSWYALTDRKGSRYTMPMLALLFGWLDDDASVRSDRRKLVALKEKGRRECD